MSLTGAFTEWVLGRVEPLVLELGTHEFRLLDASWPAGGTLQLRRRHRVPAPPGWLASPHLETALLDPDAVCASLRQLLAGYPSREKHVAVVLPDQLCYLGFARLSAVILRSNPVAALEREIQSLAPLPLKCYDLRFEGQTTRKTGTGSLLYAAISRHAIRELADLLASEGLVALTMQPSFVGMLGLLSEFLTEPSPHPTVWLHVGHEATTVAICGHEGVKQLQLVPVGGYDWARALARQSGADPTAVKQMLYEGLILLEEPTSEAQQQIEPYRALEPLFSELLQKIYGLLQRHATDHPGEEAFQRIVISGGGGRLARFDVLVRENLGVPVTSFDSFTAPVLGGTSALPASELPDWLPGLALLRQRPWQRQRLHRLVA